MSSELSSRVTEIVAQLSHDGDGASPQELLELVYGELRRLAQHYMRGERQGHSLQATAVVHEAYLRLIDQDRIDWQGRRHFFAAGARAMRQVLIDHARRRGRAKRGGDWQRITVEGIVAFAGRDLDADELLDLNAAIDRLASHDERQARLVELRFFAGLTIAEIAELLGVSKRTAEGDWAHARAWLKRELAPARPLESP
jgi:RNA polymerase sigma factor (TIGR02999 family)